MAEKFFKVPFANEGDRLAVPDVIQADGSISFTQGYGFDYERDQATDPQAKDISRESFNSLLYDITSVLGDIQRTGVQPYMSEITYSKGSIVWFNEELYLSLVNSNNEDPASETWVKINETASLEKKGIAQLTNIIDDSEDKAATPKAINIVKKKADQVPDPAVDQIVIGKDGKSYALISIDDLKKKLGVPAATQIVQTTGTSVTDVMSQNAVTKQLFLGEFKNLMGSRAQSVTYYNNTDRVKELWIGYMIKDQSILYIAVGNGNFQVAQVIQQGLYSHSHMYMRIDPGVAYNLYLQKNNPNATLEILQWFER